jgi:hypothetical protein
MFSVYYKFDQIKVDNMGGACSTHEGSEKRVYDASR